MSKFKVGDVVQRKSHPNDITKYLGCGNNGTYTVTDVNSNGSLIQLDGWDDVGKDSYPWYSNNFVLAESDELPQAPGSVLYNDEYPDRTAYNQTWLRVYLDSIGTLITLHSGQYGDESRGVGMRLSADAALQLCHDLRRMAMSIKKNGKQDAAK